MTGKLMFVPDTHVVVPREPDKDFIRELKLIGFNNAKDDYESIIQIAPQLTAPPVLRWEGNVLMLGTEPVIWVVEQEEYCWLFESCSIKSLPKFYTQKQARRAAEKALGLPEIEEV